MPGEPYFVDHPVEATAISRGALSDDPAVQAIVTDELNVIGQRLIDKLVAEGRHQREVTEVAVEGWLAFVRASCVKWVQSQKVPRADLTEMCLSAFNCVRAVSRSEELTDKCLCGTPFSSVADLAGGDHHRDRAARNIPRPSFEEHYVENDIIAEEQRPAWHPSPSQRAV
jgi:hypothetical protein